MASPGEDALANPWAAPSPAESPSLAPAQGSEEQQRPGSFDSSSSDSVHGSDVWRGSRSSDQQGFAVKPPASLSTSSPGYHEQDYRPLQTAFDEFDPFRPEAALRSDTISSDGHGKDDRAPTSSSPAQPDATDKATSEATRTGTSSNTLPDTMASGPSITHVEKESAANVLKHREPTSSPLSNPLATIASAFRKRDFSASSSKDASRTSTPIPTLTSASSSAVVPAIPGLSSMLKPIVPAGRAAPTILIRDNEENLLIDESEKEAPPAVPSHSSPYTTRSPSKGNRMQPSQGEQGSSNTGTSDSKIHDNEEKKVIGVQVEGSEEGENTTFDFNFFLEQMRNKSSEPIAKYLRSFLREFSKKHWNVNDQIRVINDFLDFIAIKMRENEVWKNDSEREFENAVEGMEKLVMNRVFGLTFVPALEPAQQAITQTDDLERDHVLSQRIKLFQWVSEEHLDLPQHKDTASFVEFAKQELRKINLYKAPRDKLICILNCCKVIFGLMGHLGLEDGADTFIPFLILVVLRANPDHLISNVQYISRFRNPDRLSGENGYYLSSLNAAISFIETMDASSLSNIQQDQFEKNVEDAIRNLPPDDDQHELPAVPPPPPPASTSSSTNAISTEKQTRQGAATTSSGRAGQSMPNSPTNAVQRPLSEKKIPHSTSESSLQAHQQQPPPRSQSPAEATRDFFIRSSDNLQKTVSKPLQALGKIFTEMGSESEMIAGYPGHALAQRQPSSAGGQASAAAAAGHGPSMSRMQQPLSPHTATPTTPRGQRPPSLRTRSTNNLASPISPQERSTRLAPGTQGYHAPGYIPNVPNQQQQRPGAIQNRGSNYQAADFLDDSIPAEEVQATVDRNYQANFNAKIDTLVNIFSGIERETLEIVLLSNGEDVERTIEGLLDMQ